MCLTRCCIETKRQKFSFVCKGQLFTAGKREDFVAKMSQRFAPGQAPVQSRYQPPPPAPGMRPYPPPGASFPVSFPRIIQHLPFQLSMYNLIRNSRAGFPCIRTLLNLFPARRTWPGYREFLEYPAYRDHRYCSAPPNSRAFRAAFAVLEPEVAVLDPAEAARGQMNPAVWVAVVAKVILRRPKRKRSWPKRYCRRRCGIWCPNRKRTWIC